MTSIPYELVPFSNSEEARRHFEAATADYGQLAGFVLPRILASSEFYILSSLSEGPETAAVARTVERIERVTVEGGFAVRVADIVNRLAVFVRSTLLEDINTCCVIEDVLARRGDSHLAASRCPIRYIDEAVIYVLAAADEYFEVERCIRASRLTFGHSLCILVRSERLTTSTRREWSREVLTDLARDATWAVVSASSSETFLLAKL